MRYREIEDAFFIASTTDCLPYVIIHRHTGQILCNHDGLSDYEVKAARDEGVDVDGPDWVAVPNKRDLGLDRRKLTIDFAAKVLSDEDSDCVQGIFSRSGAKWHFVGQEVQDKQQAWYVYKGARTEKALRAWCAENDVPLEG